MVGGGGAGDTSAESVSHSVMGSPSSLHPTHRYGPSILVSSSTVGTPSWLPQSQEDGLACSTQHSWGSLDASRVVVAGSPLHFPLSMPLAAGVRVRDPPHESVFQVVTGRVPESCVSCPIRLGSEDRSPSSSKVAQQCQPFGELQPPVHCQGLVSMDRQLLQVPETRWHMSLIHQSDPSGQYGPKWPVLE